ncbi:MAG: MBL fold metallo-hydrolase [Dehalococcoidia bacterium]|nr:MBL fold metallo-hydrolase [Dehalococcoidia bacterium]
MPTMEITWLGHSCFRIRTKQATIVTDPVAPGKGYSLGNLNAEIVTVSHNHSGHSYIEGIRGNPKTISKPGEYEIAGALLIGLTSFHDKNHGTQNGLNTVFLMETEELSICHLGDIGTPLTGSQIEEIGKIDVLMIPVGNGSTIGASEAATIVRQIEPKIVLPMHYKTSLFQDALEPVEIFLKEMGVTEAIAKPKLNVNKSNLPLTTQVVLLELQPVK